MLLIIFPNFLASSIFKTHQLPSTDLSTSMLTATDITDTKCKLRVSIMTMNMTEMTNGYDATDSYTTFYCSNKC